MVVDLILERFAAVLGPSLGDHELVVQHDQVFLAIERKELLLQLSVYATKNPRSFCRAGLRKLSAGQINTRHTTIVADLYAIDFH